MSPLPIRGPCCLWCDSDIPPAPSVCPRCGRAVTPHGPDRTVGELADLMRATDAVIVLCATPTGYALAFCRPGLPISIAQHPATDITDAFCDPIDVLIDVVATWPKPTPEPP